MGCSDCRLSRRSHSRAGPLLIFATLFAQDAIPFSIHLASSIALDGHGLLPLLAHAGRSFLSVEAVNVAAGILVGCIVMLLGG